MLLPENRLSESFHLVLARRMATYVALLYIFAFMGILLGAMVEWLHSNVGIFPADAPLTLLEMCFISGCAAVLIPVVFALTFQPQVFDWQLDIYDTPEAELLQHNLAQLQEFVHIQRELGLLKRRAKIFLSDNISMNAVTYGGFVKAPRVVIASDIFSTFTPLEVQGILCHELGHIHFGDFFVNVGFHYLLRLLDFIFYPLRLVYDLLRRLILLTHLIPFLGVFLRVALYLCGLMVGSVILPVWTVKSLYAWQGQLREYLADDYGARLMNNADGILNSLMKLENAQLKNLADGDVEEAEPPPVPSAGEETATGGATDGENSDTAGPAADDETQAKAEAPVEPPAGIEPSPQKTGKAKKTRKPPAIKGRYRRYATVVYEVESIEPETVLQKIVDLAFRINDTHPPGMLRWKRLARVGFQIESAKQTGNVSV